jgi:hypothetical protein
LGVNHVHRLVDVPNEDHFNDPAAHTSPDNAKLPVTDLPRIATLRPCHDVLDFVNRATVLLGVLDVMHVPTKVAGRHE